MHFYHYFINNLQFLYCILIKSLKKELGLDCFVKIDNSNINIICVSDKHDSTLANNIMRLIQKDYDNKMYITVKFQKS